MRSIKEQLDEALGNQPSPEDLEKQKSNAQFESFFEPNYAPLYPTVLKGVGEDMAQQPSFEDSGLAAMLGAARGTFQQKMSEPPAPLPPPSMPPAQPKRAVASPLPQVSAPSAEQAPQAPEGPSVRDILMRQMLPPDQSRDELRDAQKSSNDAKVAAMLAQGAATTGAALSRGDKVQPNNEFYKELISQADSPVKDILAQRSALADQVKQRTAINQLAGMESGDDPQSSESKALREFYKKSFPSVAGQIPSFDLLSANDIKEHFSKPMELKLKSDDNRLKAEQNGIYKQSLLQNKVDARDVMAHQRNLRALKSDTNLRQRLQQYQNLDNAMKLVTDVDNVTPQQIDEFQQAIRANLGIKGTSGVDERDRSRLNSLGLNAARFQEFLSGNPADLAKDGKILNHLRDLARNEQSNIRSQYGRGLKAVTAGNDSVYARHPELQADLDSAIGAFQGQLTNPKDQEAIQWAQSNPDDPRAQQILKMHGM